MLMNFFLIFFYILLNRLGGSLNHYSFIQFDQTAGNALSYLMIDEDCLLYISQTLLKVWPGT